MQVQISVRLAHLEQMEQGRRDQALAAACAKPNKARSKAVELKEECEPLDPAQTAVLGAADSDGLTSGVCADFMIF